jgi:hypothetical protein
MMYCDSIGTTREFLEMRLMGNTAGSRVTFMRVVFAAVDRHTAVGTRAAA